MLPCFHHDLYRTLCSRRAFFLIQFFLFFSSFDLWSIISNCHFLWILFLHFCPLFFSSQFQERMHYPASVLDVENQRKVNKKSVEKKLTVFYVWMHVMILVYCEKWGILEIRANMKSYPTVVPLLRTHSVPPTHDLLSTLLHVSQVFLQRLANPHVIQAGWVWDEGGTVNVCIHGQSLKGV